MPPDSADRPLAPLPSNFETARLALHRVAERIVAPARKPENEISLRATFGGFGTPEFEFGGLRRQVRVEGAALVYRRGEDESRIRLTSLADAAALVAELLPSGAALDDAPLEIDDASAVALGAWYALGHTVLERLRAEAAQGADPSSALLWPEHFDLAIEAGDEATGRRANYGFSPGDADHREPYIYVGPWRDDVAGELWNATGFAGAELGYAELLRAEDQTAAALDFCRALQGRIRHPKRFRPRTSARSWSSAGRSGAARRRAASATIAAAGSRRRR